MTADSISKTGLLIADGWKRLIRVRGWLMIQFIGLALLIALGLFWTRIPEKNAGQVLLTFLVPLLIAVAFLWIQAGTIRSLLRPLDSAGKRTSLLFGAATLLLWIVIGFLLWSLIDLLDGHIDHWAGYLNSRFNAQSRSHFATYEHISSWLNKVSWLLRWVMVPGLLLPLGCTAAFGLRRYRWKRTLRVWMEWRWWPVLLVLAFIGQAWPGTFFDTLPHGTVHAQFSRAVLKIAAAYMLAVFCWLLALIWNSVLFSRPLSGNGEGLEQVAEPATLSPEGGRNEGVRLPLPDPEKDFGGNS